MSGVFDNARDSIELRLTLNVLLGNIEESIAQVWKEAIRNLNDAEIAHLTRVVQRCPHYKVSSEVVKLLMKKSYPFKEMILYQTDEDFKRRLGLDEVGKGEF
ncbi:MAG: hypothetical protein ACE5HO_07675 [bacterium]